MSEFFQIRFEHWPGGGSTEVTRVQMLRPGGAPCWAPAVNVYRCGNRFVVCMDLAGVLARDISVQAQPRRLRITGHRPPPEPRNAPGEPLQVLAMEIDYGRFEREIVLPAEIDPEQTTAEQRDGWLWIHLPLKT
jgi:HSP20 family protein